MDILSLAGFWLFALGQPEPQFPQQPGLPEIAFEETIELPGTTETRGKGPLNEAAEAGQLTRIRRFDGPAWYQREFTIPESWRGKQVVLRLERTKFTQLWFDDAAIGEQGLYTVPQEYDLTAVASPGRHRITILVDNRAERRPVQSEAHQFSDNTQTNWNGILGRIELKAVDPVSLAGVQLFPDVDRRAFQVRVRLSNTTGEPVAAQLRIRARSFNHDGPAHVPGDVLDAVEIPPGGRECEVLLPLGDGARLWDEFTSALYSVSVDVGSDAGDDLRTVETGLREFRSEGSKFVVNGRVTFLRGKHDGCVFPLTGHPPMEQDGWIRYFEVVKSWGYNHVRCHTWVPPQAAFAAADRVGIYLQPELPFWGSFDGRVRDWLMPEAERLLQEYGNHPSFAMLTLGNELGGDREVMNSMVTHLRALDGRRLYADGCNNYLWAPTEQSTNDFWISAKATPPANPERPLPVRGSFWVMDGREGHTQWGASETRTDLQAAIKGASMPVIAHETGQWSVYPDFGEISKYTGVTRARNLERFREILERRGMLDQAGDFFRASGAFAAELYREENELALRTDGFGGFQVLDLQDFPGQGTALVGLLDAFMDSKGFVTAGQFRQSCSPIVPLARFDRYTWTLGESYEADLQLAHYGPGTLTSARVSWSLVDAHERMVAQGHADHAMIEQGGLRNLGHVGIPLRDLPAPARYDFRVEVSAMGESWVNQWPVWVYPQDTDTRPPSGVHLARAFDDAAKDVLAAGGRVVLMPDDANWANTLPGGYTTDFWNWPMFNGSPGTLGLLIDPAHPALAEFPTSFHSERQWASIAHASSPVVLTDAPAGLRPIVQVIDNCERAEKLGLIFEGRVGPGRLLVCAVNLAREGIGEKAEARQLLASLLRYAASAAFDPKVELGAQWMDTDLRPSASFRGEVVASSHFQPPWGFVPTVEHAVDGDLNTRWQAADGDERPELTIDLGAPDPIGAIELVWHRDLPGYRYTIEGSTDGVAWTTLSDQRANTFPGWRHRVGPEEPGAVARYLRIRITGVAAGGPAALREVRVTRL